MEKFTINEDLTKYILNATPEYGEAIVLDIEESVNAYISGFETGFTNAFVKSFLLSSACALVVIWGGFYVGRKVRDKWDESKFNLKNEMT